MKSPFPGMDPYMEQRWRSTHARLIVYAADALNASLPAGFRADMEERLVVERMPEERRPISPDGYILDLSNKAGPGGGEGGTAVMTASARASTAAAPLVFERPIDPRPQGFLQIVDQDGRGSVVAVIEFLSPTNKVRGDGRRQYLQKQRETLEANINLVEIDLTRQGLRELALMPPEASGVTYLTCVTRGFARPRYEVYPMPVRDPLPTIRVPVRDGAADVELPLQTLIEQVYAVARLAEALDYAAPLRPALPPDDGAWAAGLVSTHLGDPQEQN